MKKWETLIEKKIQYKKVHKTAKFMPTKLNFHHKQIQFFFKKISFQTKTIPHKKTKTAAKWILNKNKIYTQEWQTFSQKNSQRKIPKLKKKRQNQPRKGEQET